MLRCWQRYQWCSETHFRWWQTARAVNGVGAAQRRGTRRQIGDFAVARCALRRMRQRLHPTPRHHRSVVMESLRLS